MMFKGNGVFVLLIVLQTIYFVVAQPPYYYSDEDTDDDRADKCVDESFKNSTNFPSSSVKYQDRVMKLNEYVVTYQLKPATAVDGKSECVEPIDTEVRACDGEQKPLKVEFDAKTNTVTVKRDKESANWTIGILETFQTCSKVKRNRNYS